MNQKIEHANDALRESFREVLEEHDLDREESANDVSQRLKRGFSDGLMVIATPESELEESQKPVRSWSHCKSLYEEVIRTYFQEDKFDNVRESLINLMEETVERAEKKLAPFIKPEQEQY